ncbi:MAG: hypothetical protein V4665_04535 [Patescibacteria group bacterium]
MITKEQYLELLSKEFRIIKHLAEKILPEQLEHKPTEKQRTTLELLHYLTYIFMAGADGVATGDADAWKKYSGTPMPTLENFAEMLDAEEKKVHELLSPLSEGDLQNEIDMWGRKQSRAFHLIGLLNMAVAYKMQLFLYMKQSGTYDIGTMNLWAGMDQPPKVS